MATTRTPSQDSTSWDHARLTKRTKLPGLMAPNMGSPAADRWAQAVTEHLEVYAGGRGQADSAAATRADLKVLHNRIGLLDGELRAVSRRLAARAKVPGEKLEDVDSLNEALAELDAALDELAAEVTRVANASSTGLSQANSRLADMAVQLDTLAAEVDGLRYLASGQEAAQGEPTGSVSAVDEFYQDGSPGSARVTQEDTTEAGLVAGLRARRTMRARTSGGARAGVGLAATETGGQARSAVVVQGEEIALVPPSYLPALADMPDEAAAWLVARAAGLRLNLPLEVRAPLSAPEVHVARSNVLATGARNAGVVFDTSVADTGVPIQGDAFVLDTGQAIDAAHWAQDGPRLSVRAWPAAVAITGGPGSGPAVRLAMHAEPLFSNEWDAGGVAAAGVGRVLLRCVPVLTLLEPAAQVTVGAVRWVLYSAG